MVVTYLLPIVIPCVIHEVGVWSIGSVVLPGESVGDRRGADGLGHRRAGGIQLGVGLVFAEGVVGVGSYIWDSEAAWKNYI